MKTLKESIKFTLEKKTHQISKLKNSHFIEPIEELEAYLKDIEDDSFIGENYKYISIWNHWNFINDFISKNILNYNYLAKSTYYSLESNNYDFFIGELVQTYHSAISFTKSIKHLGQMLYLGQKENAIKYGNFLLKMLYGKQYNGWIVFPTHPWFMLALFCKWQNITLDYEKLNYPDNMGVYHNALDNWNTIDTQLLSNNIDSLSKFHITQSDEDELGNANDENGDGYDLEFTSADYFIFPVEILMWLAIRRDLGLPEYKPSSANKLMQLEINQLPSATIPMYKDALIQKCKNKLMQENSDITFKL
ncbi:hypothetical protein [Cellulophaga sp. Z1A5H]|uniref:hypothetical protein n=1 Tax=Cellulophaga sp. Z1A5H TaxID=2687291 RepID=UPI0013FE0838|nr:hypothetical protein [Cellulophaga sp. Z1A5H]